MTMTIKILLNIMYHFYDTDYLQLYTKKCKAEKNTNIYNL